MSAWNTEGALAISAFKNHQNLLLEPTGILSLKGVSVFTKIYS
jgi:hypothetical protein